MVMFQESVLYCHVDGRKVEVKEKFVDTWAKGFNIVSKGESLTQWFESWSELQPVREKDVAEDYDDPTFSELEEMALDNEDDYVINLYDRHIWGCTSDDSLHTSSGC